MRAPHTYAYFVLDGFTLMRETVFLDDMGGYYIPLGDFRPKSRARVIVHIFRPDAVFIDTHAEGEAEYIQEDGTAIQCLYCPPHAQMIHSPQSSAAIEKRVYDRLVRRNG